jgi:hypothetical protein
MRRTGVIPLSGVVSLSQFDASQRVRDASISNSWSGIGGLLAESGFVVVSETEIPDTAGRWSNKQGAKQSLDAPTAISGASVFNVLSR